MGARGCQALSQPESTSPRRLFAKLLTKIDDLSGGNWPFQQPDMAALTNFVLHKNSL